MVKRGTVFKNRGEDGEKCERAIEYVRQIGRKLSYLWMIVIKTGIPISDRWTVLRLFVGSDYFTTAFNAPVDVKGNFHLYSTPSVCSAGEVDPFNAVGRCITSGLQPFFRQRSRRIFLPTSLWELGQYYTMPATIKIELSTLKLSRRCRDSRNPNCRIPWNLLTT